MEEGRNWTDKKGGAGENVRESTLAKLRKPARKKPRVSKKAVVGKEKRPITCRKKKTQHEQKGKSTPATST